MRAKIRRIKARQDRYHLMISAISAIIALALLAILIYAIIEDPHKSTTTSIDQLKGGRVRVVSR